MKRKMPLALVETDRRTTREKVYEAIRRGVLGGVLEGGSRLIQAEIAEALGVSTTPIREALRDLASEGLIRFDSYRGAVVHSPTLDDIREIYKLRVILEPVAIRDAIDNLTDTELERASEVQRRMDVENDLGLWVDLNSEFHAIFEEATRSPRMSAILKNLRDSAAVVVGLSYRVRPTLIKSSNREHHLLLDACRARDKDAASQIIETHFRETVKAMERYFRERKDAPSKGSLGPSVP